MHPVGNKQQLHRNLVSFRFKLLALFLPLVLLAAIACGPGEAQTLEGILQSIDLAEGEVVIVTQEGKTFQRLRLAGATGYSSSSLKASGSSWTQTEKGQVRQEGAYSQPVS